MPQNLHDRSLPFFRLNCMMFLQFFILGSSMPIMSLYLKNELCFTGTQIGFVLGAGALSTLMSPVVSAVIADRLLSAERLLSLLHLLAAVLLFFLQAHSGFVAVLILYLLYWLVAHPTTALTTAITFHHTPTAEKQFGGIRLWGTLGWIAAAWTFKWYCDSLGTTGSNFGGHLRGALMIGVAGSLLLGLFSLTLPKSITSKHKKIVLLPKDSLQVICSPSTLVLALFATLIAIADRIYIYGGGLYLKALGFQEKNIMPVLSIGQIPEIFGLALLGFCITRIGIKRTLILGTILEVVRFLLFSFEVSGIPLFGAISLHGLTYAYFFITASIYLDKNSTAASRSGAHQYFALIVSGSSTLIGNLIAGIVADYARIGNTPDPSFLTFWSVPLVLSLAGLFGIIIFFKETATIPPTQPGLRPSDLHHVDYEL